MRARSCVVFPWFILALMLSALFPSATAQAQVTVRVLETHPAGSEVTLTPRQNFHLRLAYSTDSPTQIWIRPYFQGKPVNAGTNPSPVYHGSGEALVWFFFLPPGGQVDEIRIVAGDGSTGGTSVVAGYRVRVVAASAAAGAATPEPEPAWVSELRDRAQSAMQEAQLERMQGPDDGSGFLLMGSLMLLLLLVGLLGFVLPIWMLKRWHGGWRIAAAMPLALMLLVVLNIVVGVAFNPRSHNLWPFEILMAGALCSVFSLLLLLARKFSGANARGGR